MFVVLISSAAQMMKSDAPQMKNNATLKGSRYTVSRVGILEFPILRKLTCISVVFYNNDIMLLGSTTKEHYSIVWALNVRFSNLKGCTYLRQALFWVLESPS